MGTLELISERRAKEELVGDAKVRGRERAERAVRSAGRARMVGWM